MAGNKSEIYAAAMIAEFAKVVCLIGTGALIGHSIDLAALIVPGFVLYIGISWIARGLWEASA